MFLKRYIEMMGNNIDSCSSEKIPSLQNEEISNSPFEVIVVGDIVGKSCIMNRFCTGMYDPCRGYTVGFDCGIKTLFLDNDEIKLRIWDIANHETMYRSFLKFFGDRAPNGIILVYDITNENTFSNLRTKWMKLIQHDFGSDAPIILVGNKCDLKCKRVVQQSEVEEFCNDFPEIDCAVLSSAKTNENIDFIFTYLATEMKRRNCLKMKMEK